MFFLIVLLFLGATFLIQLAQTHQAKVAWSGAAEALGLHVDLGRGLSPRPKLSGAIGDVQVKVEVDKPRNGNHNNIFTGYTVRHAPVGPPVAMRRQGMLSRFAAVFGGRDVVVGDPFFDDKIVVDSPHEDAAREFLTPARQAIILEVFNRWRHADVDHVSIRVRTASVERKQAAIVETVRRLVAMAEVMGDPAGVDRALTKQLHGDMADAIADLHALNEQQPNVFVETLEAEGLVELGDHEQAQRVFQTVAQQLEIPEPKIGWDRLASLPPPVALPVPETPDVEQQAAIDDLFASDRLSFEIVEHFEHTYAHAIVAWSGEVSNYHSYQHDTDFTDGPGMKVTVLLGGAGKSSLVSNEVHAVVQLPRDSEIERGGNVAFRGTLVRVDRFARKLYVSAATLT